MNLIEYNKRMTEQAQLLEAYDWLLHNASPDSEHRNTYIALIDQCMVERESLRMFQLACDCEECDNDCGNEYCQGIKYEDQNAIGDSL